MSPCWKQLSKALVPGTVVALVTKAIGWTVVLRFSVTTFVEENYNKYRLDD